MTFTASIWLLGLLPWAAAVVMLLTSRRRPWGVPFLHLWRLNAPREAVRRRFAAPPIAVVLGLLAALAAVLAAAGPGVRAAGSGGLVVVVDAGTSMSARGSVDLRFREAAAALAAILREAGRADLPIEWVVVPGPRGGAAVGPGRRIVAADLAAAAAAEPATALNTRDALDHQLRARLADDSTRVIAVTDQPLAVTSDRLVQITPAEAGPNVGIRRLAVRRSPVPQAMVRVGRSGAATQPINVRVTAGGRAVERRIEPPPAGGTRDLFVDLPRADDEAGREAGGGTATYGVVTAELVGHAMRSPATTARSSPPRRIGRSSSRPCRSARCSGSSTCTRPADRRGSGRCGCGSCRPRRPTPPPTVRDCVTSVGRTDRSPPARPARRITRSPAWSATGPRSRSRPRPTATAGRAVGGRARRRGRQPARRRRRVGGRVGVAARTRQVWSAIDPRGWANQVEYVSFWSAVFDWAGGADEAGDAGDGTGGAGGMTSAALGELSPDWRAVELASGPAPVAFWPGLYERRATAGGGRSARPSRWPPASSSARRAGRARPAADPAGGPNRPLVALAARDRVGLALAAAGVWPRGRHAKGVGWAPPTGRSRKTRWASPPLRTLHTVEDPRSGGTGLNRSLDTIFAGP
jgi:hypothetical protein